MYDELSDEFWSRRQWLRRMWDEHRLFWTDLDYDDQRVLHDYYAPAKDLVGEELVAWLRSDRPNWATSAEEADEVFCYARDHWLLRPAPVSEPPSPEQRLPLRPKPKRGRRGSAYIASVEAPPEIDLNKLARALLQAVREKQQNTK